MINRKSQARKPALSGDRSRRTWLLCLSITAAFSILPLIMLALSLASCHPRVHMYHGSAAESSLCRVVRAFGIMTGEREDSSQPVASLAPKTIPSPTHQSMSPVLPSTSTSASSPSPPPPQVLPSPSPPGPPNPSSPTVVSSASASNNMNIDKAGPLLVTTPGADLNKLNVAGVVNSPAGGLGQGGKEKKTSKQEIDHVEHPQSDEDIERIVSFPHVSECNLCKVCIPHQEVANHPRAKAVEARMAYMLAHGDLLEEALAAPLTPGSDVDPDTQDTGRKRRQLMSNPHLWEDEDNESSLLQPSGSYITDSMDGGVIQVVDDERHRYILDPNAAAAVRGSGKQGTVRGSSRALAEMDEVLTDGLFRFMGRTIDISQVAPGADSRAPRRMKLQNCTICWGCKHKLELMASGDMLFGSYYAHEPGGSPSWLFQVRTNKTASGWAVVKTWCVPVLKVKQRGYAPCSPQKAFTQVKLLLAQQKLSRECGFNQIVPKLWIEPIHGVVPGHGFHIDWLGLWFDIAEGVSVQNIQESGQPPMKPELMLDIFHTINHTEIKLSALFDVLTSQCDRHQQNMFVTKDRKLMIIDNDQVYATSWRKCGFDSMILPTTQKFMINHIGFFYVLKYPHNTPEGPPKTCDTKLNPLLLLDYRCHVNNGSIGFDYPPQVQQCMANLAKKSPNEIYLEYGYPVLRMAEALRNRSRDMTEHGFEWTLLRGEPTNQPMHRYKMAPACCKMHFETAGRKYVCDTPGYHQMCEVPYGNPWHGGKWHGTPGKDTGTYVGGEGL